ncbi:Wadjet anti-phage system protein JetD domain-containing protein [Brevibacillus formosus]|uniref:Wadjet anti-phage system protein JetD domain-containing protein n=1 Tax=Brevibacillus formosus TaxID=54913 RepID=UPI0018CF2B4E|nr:Wadjet anti-phage system protein JetD domain-containing protein [Brevibacillus formosus]MBG9941005.1 hypothetical protein [Brevibacillus formosus]
MDELTKQEDLIIAFLRKQKNKRFETLLLQKHLSLELKGKLEYKMFAKAISNLIEKKTLLPVISRGKNGMDPILYRWHQFMDAKPKITEEVLLEMEHTYTWFSMDYYKKHPEAYAEDRSALLAIQEYLANPNEDVLSVNERMYYLFNDEKWLERNGKILTRIGISEEKLGCSDEPDPFLFFPRKLDGRKTINALIVENKATFKSLKMLFIEGITSFGGTEFHLLIFGGGNQIVGSFPFFYELEIYQEVNVQFFYFGDLDLQGIYIWHQLNQLNSLHVQPFTLFYEILLKHNRHRWKEVEPNQTYSEEGLEQFLTFFGEDMKLEVWDQLMKRTAIQQEGLHRTLLRGLGDRVE